MHCEPPEPNVILVVDDTPSDIQVLLTLLEKDGLRVVIAENGQKALQITESIHPNLILIDVIMSSMNGFETCRHLKTKPSLRETPVIFLTSVSDQINKAEGLQMGGIDYISKPIDESELLTRIRTYLRLQQMQQYLANQSQTLEQEKQLRLQAERKLEQALKFKSVLEGITEKIRDRLDEDEILQTVTIELAKVLEIDRCQIELYNFNHTEATITYEYSRELPRREGVTRQVQDFPELYEQLLQKIPVQLTEAIPLSNSQTSPQTCLAYPIFEPQDIVGLVGNLRLFKPDGEVFNPLEIDFVEQVASQCAIAIRQARLYKAKQQQIKAFEKLNRIKDEFLKTISHELRTPMSSIKLATQTLEKFLEDESILQKSSTFSKVLEIFRQACRRHNQLVDDLISLCYLEAQAETLVFEWVDLNIWLPEIVQPFLERVNRQQQQFFLDISPELPLLKSDISMLERVVRELLDNACKYTPVGDKITVSVAAIEESILLTVSNSGIEISTEEQQRVFDQFYRIPHHDPWKYGGTGLGLTLVQKLVELLEASIELKSAENLTQFVIKFPLDRLETPPIFSLNTNTNSVTHSSSNCLYVANY
ncbi:MAG: response regulator [Cyanobacteria bacterium J06592_8]